MAEKHPYARLKMEKLAPELGYICIYWGWIEHSLDDFITELARLEVGDVARSITGNADIRAKVQMAKALAFIRKDDKLWFSETLELLDYIDNDLRVRRNNYIHARWHTAGGKLGTLRHKTKLSRPQSFQLTLSTLQDTPVKIGEIRKLCKDMYLTFTSIFALFGYIMRDEKHPIDPSWPPLSFEQYLRVIRQSSRQKRGRKTPQRPHQS